MRRVLPVVPAKHNPHYLIFKSCKSLGLLKQKFSFLLCTFWSVLWYNVRHVRMLFPSIETGTAINVRDSENYLPIFFRAEIYRGQLLILITGSSSRLLRIRFSADLTMYWFPVYHFRCMKFKPLVIWIWNHNIAISAIVGTSSHIIVLLITVQLKYNLLSCSRGLLFCRCVGDITNKCHHTS